MIINKKRWVPQKLKMEEVKKTFTFYDTFLFWYSNERVIDKQNCEKNENAR
jgi:hypothetical protein